MVTQKFDLNMIPGRVKPIVHVSQYDTGLRALEISLYADTEAYAIPAGAVLTIQGTKPDYTGFSYGSISYAGNVVSVDCTDQMTACAGAVEVEIVVVLNGERIASANFVMQVKSAAFKDDTIISETDIPIIEQLPQMMDDIDSLIGRFGSPNVAETAAEMTDTDKVYVYVGSETGYEYGHWYYHDPADDTWKSGGIYQSAGVVVDRTLKVDGEAADAKATGDAIRAVDAAVNGLTYSEANSHIAQNGSNYEWQNGGRTRIYDISIGDTVEITAGERAASVITYTENPGSVYLNVITNDTIPAGTSRTAQYVTARKLALLIEDTQGNDVSPAVFEINGISEGLVEDVEELKTTKQDALTFDSAPTEGSTNPVTSGGVWDAVQTDKTLAVEDKAADAKITGDAIAELNSALSKKIDINGEHQVKPQNIEGVLVSGGNVLEDAERLYSTQAGTSKTDGYVLISNGTAIIQETTPYCSFLIPVKTNTHYTANHQIRFAVLLKDLNTSGKRPVRYSTVVGSLLTNIYSFDTGEADHIIVSWNYKSFPIDNFVISEGDTPTSDQTITLPDWLKLDDIKPKHISTTGYLSDGTFLALMGYKQNLRKGERYVFSGSIGTISSLHFGFTNANAFSASSKILNEFTIDATNITYKTDSTNENYTNQYAHGLTLANNLQFVFEYLPEGNAKITLVSNGELFTQTLLFTKWTISQVVVLSTGSTLTDCKLTWTPIDIDKYIWMFGDSYFAYNTARWPYYLQQYGYAKNTLIDGWPGEGSVNARNSLMTLVQFGTPKYIVWCMGMNDGSDTDASTPNSNWTIRRDEMLTICNENGITPIFATIPNVPSILHTGKNAWIKASGYRYIDFAKAVGAESANSTWFAGMLSSDNVHPTEQGARALFARALLDFPEIMLDGTN